MTRLWTCLLLVCALSGCWKQKSYFQTAVWSDDDAELLLVQSLFEQNGDDCQGSFLCTTRQRNFRMNYYVERAAPSGDKNTGVRVQLGGQRTGSLYGTAYFMRAKGYAVVGRTTETELLFERLALDGSARTIATSPHATSTGDLCPRLNVVPSPDGALLAVIRHEGACSERKATVEFLRADTLAVAHPTVTVAMPSLPSPTATRPFMGFMTSFTPSGGLVFSTVNDPSVPETQLLVVPGRQPVSTAPLRCYHPETRSSEVSSTGQIVYMSGNTVMLGGLTPSMAFGCQ